MRARAVMSGVAGNPTTTSATPRSKHMREAAAILPGWKNISGCAQHSPLSFPPSDKAHGSPQGKAGAKEFKCMGVIFPQQFMERLCRVCSKSCPVFTCRDQWESPQKSHTSLHSMLPAKLCGRTGKGQKMQESRACLGQEERTMTGEFHSPSTLQPSASRPRRK